MAGKQRIQRYIDAQPAVRFGATPIDATEDLAPPAIPTPDTVEDLALDSFLQRSAATPFALISATWSQPDGSKPQRYAVQWSVDSDFPSDNTGGFDAPYPSCSIEGLKTNTLYYVRVAAVYRTIQGAWCDAVSITTENDTVPPSQPASISWDWQADGDLLIRFTPATEENYRDTEIRIWSDSGKTTLYTTGYAAPGFFMWPLAEQLRAQSNPSVLDSAVYIELRSRNWAETYSSPATPASQPSKAAPTAPAGLTTSWAGEVVGAGVAGAGCVISWTADPLIRRWVLTIDGVARDVAGNKSTYTLDANKAEHSGTPDYALSVDLVGYDALGQVSPASSITATNAAPATTAVSITAGFSSMAINITPSAAADLRDYTVRIIKDGSTQATIRSSSPDLTYKATARGSYTVGVIVNDVFGQPSTETVSSAVVLDALTIDELRADTIYTDSVGNSASTLAILKDGSQASSVSYALSASAYRWTQAERALLERYKQMNVVLDTSVTWYVATSADGSTWTWFAGPIAADGRTLTAVANEAAAQAAAVSAATLGNGSGASRVQLPSVQEARYVRLYHRRTGGSYGLYEFYPRRLVQADDVEAESLRAIHIAANSITADRMSVLQLSAIAADMGTITAGTITGAIIRSAASGARWEGNSTRLFGTDGTTTQWEVLNSTGKFTGGGGNVIIDADGLAIKTSGTYNDSTSLRFITNLGNLAGFVTAYPTVGYHEVRLVAPAMTNQSASTIVEAIGSGSLNSGSVKLQASSAYGSGYLRVVSDSTGNYTETDGGLTIGNSHSTPGAGEIRTVGTVNSTRLWLKSDDTSDISFFAFAGRPGVSFTETGVACNYYASSGTMTRENTSIGASYVLLTPTPSIDFHVISSGGTDDRVVEFTSTLIRPRGAGVVSLGDATNYFNNIGYKTITDYGCLALVDTWELPDGRMVSNSEVIRQLRAHPTEKTIYGEVKLDYQTVPKHSRKPAPIAEDDIYEDDPNDLDERGSPKRKRKHKKGDKLGDDGVEMTAMFSVMIGMLREQDREISALKAAVADLQGKHSKN